ncbi:sodium/bile acid cotransporter 7-B-like [Coccinella septempunctata]|uniref:sodium/bile acid cotransporter 7-B-like n=1 Tax=Coccinella septempunctata TaxID=41139 RepID=UPI001D05EC49|nr:sodium/bile acid cotransporter 7-B-like [Coccinella septempunctata]
MFSKSKHRVTPEEYIKRNWLLVAIITCIFLAGIYPKFGSKEGPLYTQYSVKYGAICIIFLISGLTLKTSSIFRTFQQYKLHLFIQTFTFILIPIVTQVFVKFLSLFGTNSWILRGLITVSCMPPPVSSAVILTRTAKGNETASIFNSVLGSFLGIVLTPILLLFNLGSTMVVPLLATVIQLTTTVLIPLIIGQVVRNFTNFKEHKFPLNTIGQAALLFVIYTTFCDTFLVSETGLSAIDVLITVLAVLFLQISFMLISFFLSQYFSNSFTRADIVSITFCSTHKSLTLGIPILRIMFQGYSHLSQISLPLLVYHPTQIILGGMVVSQLKDWILLERGRKPPI